MISFIYPLPTVTSRKLPCLAFNFLCRKFWASGGQCPQSLFWDSFLRPVMEVAKQESATGSLSPWLYCRLSMIYGYVARRPLTMLCVCLCASNILTKLSLSVFMRHTHTRSPCLSGFGSWSWVTNKWQEHGFRVRRRSRSTVFFLWWYETLLIPAIIKTHTWLSGGSW